MKFDAIAKAIVIKEAAELAAKKAAKKFRKIDWDGDVLNRVGLTTYKPGWGALGGISLFVFGAAVGGIAALMLAPKKGEELRADVMKFVNKEQANLGYANAPISNLETNPNARV